MFDKETLRKFEFIRLSSRRALVGSDVGARRGGKLGGGVEFVDYRDYAQGDDLRNLDWNVYARLERPYVKRYRDDSDLPTVALLDVSKSMARSRDSRKFELAKNIVGALGYVALSGLDSFGVYAFTNRTRSEFPLVRGRERFWELARYLEALRPYDGETDLVGATKDVLARVSKAGLAIIVSDCYDAPGLELALERLIARRFEPIVLCPYDEDEIEPQGLGDFIVEDVETGRELSVSIDESVLKRYRRLFQEFIERNRRACLKRGARFYYARASVALEKLVLEVARDSALGR